MKIVFDVTLMRPGCVLLQSALGGTLMNDDFEMRFDSSTWILAPTPDLACYEITEEQLAKLEGMVRDHAAKLKEAPKS